MTNSIKTAFLLGLLTALIIVVGTALGGRGGAILALLFAAGMNFFSYWFSDRLVLTTTRARLLTREESPRLFAIVDRLCARSGLPFPRLYLLPQAAMNAFATGRNPRSAAVAVTQGILDHLDEDELEGVVAHELSHVQNRDILISSVVATLAGAIMVLANMARWGALVGGFGGRSNDRSGGVIGALATMLLAPVAAVLIQMAVSRSREFQADASAAKMVGHPHGLARALEKLDQHARQVPFAVGGGATLSHLFIVQPFLGRGMRTLFSTHPPIAERIRRLLGR